MTVGMGEISMRELAKQEICDVSGGGIFGHITGFGLMVLSVGVGWTFGGPVGAAAAVAIYGAGKGSEAIYDMSNDGREERRIENFKP